MWIELNGLEPYQHNKVLAVYIPGDNLSQQSELGLSPALWNPDNCPYLIFKKLIDRTTADYALTPALATRIIKNIDFRYAIIFDVITDQERIKMELSKLHAENVANQHSYANYFAVLPSTPISATNVDINNLVNTQRNLLFFNSLKLQTEKFYNPELGGTPEQCYYKALSTLYSTVFRNYEQHTTRKKQGFKGFFRHTHGQKGLNAGSELKTNVEATGNINDILDRFISFLKDPQKSGLRPHSLKVMLMTELGSLLDIQVPSAVGLKQKDLNNFADLVKQRKCPEGTPDAFSGYRYT